MSLDYVQEKYREEKENGNLSGLMKDFLGGGNSMGPMDYEQAYEQAEEILSPQFKQQRQELSRNQRQRGFYGQMPGDVMEQQLASQQVAQTGQMATDLQHQDWQRQMQQEQFEFQQQQYEDQQSSDFWGTIGGIAGGILGGPAGAAIGTGAGNLIGNIF